MPAGNFGESVQRPGELLQALLQIAQINAANARQAQSINAQYATNAGNQVAGMIRQRQGDSAALDRQRESHDAYIERMRTGAALRFGYQDWDSLAGAAQAGGQDIPTFLRGIESADRRQQSRDELDAALKQFTALAPLKIDAAYVEREAEATSRDLWEKANSALQYAPPLVRAQIEGGLQQRSDLFADGTWRALPLDERRRLLASNADSIYRSLNQVQVPPPDFDTAFRNAGTPQERAQVIRDYRLFEQPNGQQLHVRGDRNGSLQTELVDPPTQTKETWNPVHQIAEIMRLKTAQERDAAIAGFNDTMRKMGVKSISANGAMTFSPDETDEVSFKTRSKAEDIVSDRLGDLFPINPPTAQDVQRIRAEVYEALGLTHPQSSDRSLASPSTGNPQLDLPVNQMREDIAKVDKRFQELVAQYPPGIPFPEDRRIEIENEFSALYYRRKVAEDRLRAMQR